MRNVTLKDIAAELGVSVATVSKALNDKPDIGEALKRTVRKLADEKGYRQHYFASALALSRPNNLIGYIIPSAGDLFTPQITRSIEDSVFEGGYNLLLAQSDNQFLKERRLIDDFMEKRISGLILIAAPGRDNADYYQRVIRELPVVFVDQHPGVEANCVLTNDREVSCQAIEYLVGLGHRRILVLGGQKGAGTTERRLDGCRLAMKKTGLRMDMLLEAQIGFQQEDARDELVRLAQEGKEYSAVLCLSNRVACGAISYFRDRNLRIPEDVSLIGFASDADEGGIRSLPGCTIIKQPTYEYGQKAVELLYKIIGENNTAASREIELPSSLQIGNSTAAPA